MLLNVGEQLLVQCKLLLHFFVALKQLYGVPAQKMCIDLALDGFFDMGDGVFHTAGENMGQFAAAGSLGGGNRLLSGLAAALTL